MDLKTNPRRRFDDYSMALVEAIATVMKAQRMAGGRPLRPCPVAVPGWREAGAPWTLVQHTSSPSWELLRQEQGKQVTAFRWASNIDDAARRMLTFDATRPLVDYEVAGWLTEQGEAAADGLALTPEGLAASHA